MKIVYPIAITDAMVKAGTSISAEDSTPAWSASGDYGVGDEVHLVSTHKVYRCAVAGVSPVSPDVAITRWKAMRPTNRWAPFDTYTATAAKATGSLTYVLEPGFFNSVFVYAQADVLAVSVKDAPGGSVVWSRTVSLVDDPLDWYEWFFSLAVPLSTKLFSDIPVSATAEVTVTLTSTTGGQVALGMLMLGDYMSLIPMDSEAVEGLEQGATLEPVTNSFVDFNDDGELTIVRRPAATNLRGQLTLSKDSARYAVWVLRRVLDMPVAVVLTDFEGFEDLTTVGLISSIVSYRKTEVNINLNVKGII